MSSNNNRSKITEQGHNATSKDSTSRDSTKRSKNALSTQSETTEINQKEVNVNKKEVNLNSEEIIIENIKHNAINKSQEDLTNKVDEDTSSTTLNKDKVNKIKDGIESNYNNLTFSLNKSKETINEQVKKGIDMQPQKIIKKKDDINTNSSDELDSKDSKYYINKIFLDERKRDALIKSLKTINKDIDLKILGKLLYNKKKYYCEIECKLFDSSYYGKYKKEEISDIDVYAIKFDESLSCHKAGFECKSTTNNGVDEILKIKGIQVYNNLDKVGLFKKKIANNVRLIAKKIDVELYDEKELNDMVSIIIPEYKKRAESEKLLYVISTSIEYELKQQLRGIVSFTKGAYWTNSPDQNFHTIVRALEHIKEIKTLMDYQRMYIVLRLSLLLSLSILQIASFIIKTNFSNIQNCALDEIFGGTVERWEKFRTYDLISQELRKKVSPYPYYIKDYLNIISWIVSSMNEASRLPLLIEQYIRCYLLKLDYNFLTNFYSDTTLKLSKDILRFSCKILQDDKIFEHIFKI
ncbi:hypothetical protein [Clostridium kluyveri]|uniref:Uncharacterized protein n=1 Tax=Clostridium kluyveri TaxID=1534 RepID=A0A1L5FB05_CLOKL|nr:hypothetical protein [Clostridium kluyveri]APM40179.1 hypothetical protein BS101_16235 [Clostridium kluyveri]